MVEGVCVLVLRINYIKKLNRSETPIDDNVYPLNASSLFNYSLCALTELFTETAQLQLRHHSGHDVKLHLAFTVCWSVRAHALFDEMYLFFISTKYE